MSVARAAFGIMANEALKHAADARERDDAKSAAMFDEIGMMMLGMAIDGSSPLLEVVNERRQRHKTGRNVEFTHRRMVHVALALLEMDRTGCTRHAACQRVAALIHKRDGEARSISAGRELAKHVPLSLAEIGTRPIAVEAKLMVDTVAEALKRKMPGGAEPPLEWIYLALAPVSADWRRTDDMRDDRTATLRTLFGSPARQTSYVVDLDALGDKLLAAIVAKLQPPF